MTEPTTQERYDNVLGLVEMLEAGETGFIWSDVDFANIVPFWWLGRTRAETGKANGYCVGTPETAPRGVTWAYQPPALLRIVDDDGLVKVLKNEWLPCARKWLKIVTIKPAR